MEKVFSWLAVLLALIAAFLWAKASYVIVSREDAPNAGGFFHGEANVYLTVRAQSKWNVCAAAVTAAATLSQALSLFTHQL